MWFIGHRSGVCGSFHMSGKGMFLFHWERGGVVNFIIDIRGKLVCYLW